MIPSYTNEPAIVTETKLITIKPSRTYKLDLTRGRVIGKVDEVEAIKQAIIKQLLTERYAYLIYDWNYGVGLEKYIGLGFSYLETDIRSALEECLLLDDRILAIDNVVVKKGDTIDSVIIEFSVTSIYGTVSGMVVNKNVL